MRGKRADPAFRAKELAYLDARGMGKERPKSIYKPTFTEEEKEKKEEEKKEKKEQIKEKLAEIIQCECGCSIRRDGLSRHKKTQNHQKIMNNLSKPSI